MRCRRTTGRRLALCAAPVMVLALMLGSCAHHSATRGDGRAGPSGLERAAEAELVRPSAAAKAAPVPEGVEALLANEIGLDETRARLPLEEVVRTLAGAMVEDAQRPAHPEALRRYVSGRTKLLQGDAGGAVEDLKAATELDPEAPEPWKELGEAQLVQGLRAEALRSFRASAATGRGDARTLEFLGRSALERGDFEEAGVLLARAMQAEPERADPALPSVIGVGLARSLAPQGYTTAAMESLRRVLVNPIQLTSSSRYSVELGAIFRRQGDLWRDVGDAYCRLGLFAEAVDAYRQSAGLPSLDPGSVRPRLVFALMRSGRPARASLEILNDLAGRQGRVGSEDLGLLRYIARHGGDAGQISEALDALVRAEKAASIARDLSLARARLLSGAEARAALRAHIGAFPTDVGAVVELLDSYADAARAADEAVSLVKAGPSSVKAIAEAFVRSRHSAGSSTIGRTSPAGRLLAAYITAKQGRLHDALEQVVAIPGEGEVGVVSAAAMVEIGLDAGRPETADEGVARLRRAGSGVEARRWLARSLLLMQQVRGAGEVIGEVLNDPSASVGIDDLMLAAEIAARLGRGDEAERRLTEAATLDPFDERPLSMLMLLASAEGASPDNAALNRAARDLRQNAPDSRTIRMLRARDQMRRAQWSAAEVELRALVDEDPGDGGPMEMLALVWMEREKRSPGEASVDARAWLMGHLERRPQSPLLLAMLAALDTATERPADAERALREALKAGAGPDVSRILERLLREKLNRPAEADELSRRRLADRRRTVQESLEFADLSLLWNEAENAIQILRGGLPPDVDLATDQARQALAIAGRCIVSLRGSPNLARAASDASRVFDRCLPSIPDPLPEVHQRRIEALAASADAGRERLLDAVKAWAGQYPQSAATAYLAAVQSLVTAGRTALVPDFLAGAVASGANDPRVMGLWFEAVVEFGSAQSGREMIDELHRTGKLAVLMERVAPNQDPAAIRDQRAEAGYMMGVFFAQLNRDADAASMYEYALSHDPGHAWACNNLGYWLTDRGVELERASALLERAYLEKPGETPIIDSLGWLRYKQGYIRDQVDPGTNQVTRRGAVSLLAEAALTPAGQEDNTIQDHLGDALWLAGRRDEAIAAWERAAILSRRTLDNARSNQEQGDTRPESAEVVESRALIESTTRKREAAAAGGPVRVAPQVADADPQPVEQP